MDTITLPGHVPDNRTERPNTLAAARDAHLHKLQVAEKALKTINGYGTAWTVFIKFLERTLGREALVSDYTRDNVWEFFSEYVVVNANASYTTYRTRIKLVGDFLMHEGYIPYGPHPIEGVPRRKKKVKTTRNRRLSDNEFIRLIVEAGKSHARDYYLVWFVRLSGRRISEVLHILWKDIDWESGIIYYDNTKGRKWGQKMVLTPELRALLGAWKEYYEEDAKSEINGNWYLFPSCMCVDVVRKGRRRLRILAPTAIISTPDRTLRDLLKPAGLYSGPGDGWHIIRKTVINRAKQAASDAGRGDAWDIARQIAGHESELTTRVYVDADEDFERLKEWMNANPLISDELASLTPFLKPLVEARNASIVPNETMSQEGHAQVIPLASRRPKAVVQ